MICIIDYGMGNLKSVKNALNVLEIENIISNKEEDIKSAKGLILPGVGAFKDAMKNLKALGLDVLIKEEVNNGKMLLGICLGMQLLFEKSYEVEECDGFGFIKGEVVKMDGVDIRIPHIGWNNLINNKEHNLLNNQKEEAFVYFVHSYYGADYDEDDLISYSEYGNIKIPAIVSKNNIMGAQFHPEKSGDVGLNILKNFGEMVK